MPNLECPECGTQRQLDVVRRSADEFCTHCDFPLFWAPSVAAAAAASAPTGSTLRRLPGTGGRQTVGSRDCPACGELNPLGETHCLRCSTEFDPKPIEPLPPMPLPRPPPPPPEAEPNLWWLWLIAVLILVTIVVVLLIIFL